MPKNDAPESNEVATPDAAVNNVVSQGAAEAGKNEKADPLKLVAKVKLTIDNNVAWGRSKLQSIEDGIAAVGGVPSEELKAAIADARKSLPPEA